MVSERASASYWVASQDEVGNVSLWMWNCAACEGARGTGVTDTEPQAVTAMNDHVATEHPTHEYVATPVPKS